MKANQSLDLLLKSILNGCTEKEAQNLINEFIEQLKQEIKSEVKREFFENPY